MSRRCEIINLKSRRKDSDGNAHFRRQKIFHGGDVAERNSTEANCTRKISKIICRLAFCQKLMERNRKEHLRTNLYATFTFMNFFSNI